MKWEPISTAPKTGIHILLYSKHGIAEGHWQIENHGWMIDNPSPYGMNYICEGITHWMPVPPPPET